MADNVSVTTGSGTVIAADEVTDATLGVVKVQYVKLMDGTLDGTTKATIKAANTAPVAADTAVVVAIHPSSINPNGQQNNAGSAPVTISSQQVITAQNSASPANFIAVAGQFNTTPTTITNGNASPLQLDSAGNLKVNIQTGASSGAVAQGSTTSGQTGGLTQAAVTTASPSYTNGQTNPLSMDTSGNLRVSQGTAIPAGTAIIGKVGIDQTTPGVTNGVQLTSGASQETSTIYNGTTALTPTRAVISTSSSGGTTIVAAVGGKKIRVLQWEVKVNAAVNFKWQSSVTPTDLTGLYYNSSQGDGVARGFSPIGWFETIIGEALVLNLSGAVAVGGVLTYVLV